MTPSIWNPAARTAILTRVDKLTPDLQPRWGQMSCPEMLAHVAVANQMGLGEIEAKVFKTIYRNFPLKQFFLYWVPLPKSVPAPRQIVTHGKPAPPFEESRALLLRTIDTICESRERKQWPDHPYLGAFEGKHWAVMAWKHLDHHLRQFGV